MDEFVKLLSPNLAIVNQLLADLGRPDNQIADDAETE